MIEIESFEAEYPLLNDGKRTKINFVDSYRRTAVIFKEIFEKEDYKPGLDHLKSLKKSVCIDIGGHLGFASLYFNNAEGVEIYTLEPNPDVFKAMKLNLTPYKNIHPFNLGIRGWNGTGEMTSDSTKSLPDSYYNDGDLKVSTIFFTLERFMKDSGIDHIDMLKIDIEGAEYEVLFSPGFENVAKKIDFIIGESHYTPKFGPNIIPGVLPDFNVRFLDVKNLYYKIDLNIPDVGDIEKIVPVNTLFVAERKR